MGYMQLDKNDPIKLNQLWVLLLANEPTVGTIVGQQKKKNGLNKKGIHKGSMGYVQLGKKCVSKTELKKCYNLIATALEIKLCKNRWREYDLRQ